MIVKSTISDRGIRYKNKIRDYKEWTKEANNGMRWKFEEYYSSAKRIFGNLSKQHLKKE